MSFSGLILFLYLALLLITGAKAVPAALNDADAHALGFETSTPTCQTEGKKAPVESVERMLYTFRGHYFRHGSQTNTCGMEREADDVRGSMFSTNGAGKAVYEEMEYFRGASVFLGMPEVWTGADMRCDRMADYVEEILKACTVDGFAGGYMPVLRKDYESTKHRFVKDKAGALQVFVTSDSYCDRNTTGLSELDRCIFVY
ncbi:MAG: hypothetical protein M1836_006402 [Candelina mexicana]|nr:MAG: hypothetical protein M1836_006402 [Candelina mexicana]